MPDIDEIERIFCSRHRPRRGNVEILVVHTNEGREGKESAEALARYLARPDVVPGYHLICDENSSVLGAPFSHRTNGAGGVWDRAIHLCFTGFANQSYAQWNDPASTAAWGLQGADVARQVCERFGLPMRKISDPRPGNRGICGHGDVSRYYIESQGHYDPGPHFPWPEFIATVIGKGPALKRKGKTMQLIFSAATGDTWFITDGITRRPVVAKGEPQTMFDLGLIPDPERGTDGTIRPKWVSDEVMGRIPVVG